MKSTHKNAGNSFSLVMTVAVICLMTAVVIPGVMGTSPLDLGQAGPAGGDYTILTQTGIMDGAGSVITGNIGSSLDAADGGLTGFTLDPVGATALPSKTATQVIGGGKVYAFTYGVPTPANLGLAVGATGMQHAYDSGWTPALTVTNPGAAGDIGGLVLPPGVYEFDIVMHINSDVTLDAQGDANAVWIFRTSKGFDTAAGTHVILKNGAQSDNVFWVVAMTTNLGANSVVYGTILDKTNIAFGSAATLYGRALAQTAVTLSGNTIDSANVQAPIVVPPQFVSAETNATGNLIIITFDKLMASPSGKESQFSYQIGGGTDEAFSGASLNGTDTHKIDLTTSVADIVYNDAVTVSYTNPGAGSVVANDASILATFVTLHVNNDMPAQVPTFTSIAPVSGPVAGGTSVVITGTNFTGANAVTFGGTAATSYTVDSGTSISATTPAHAAGAVNVVVTTSGGTATGTDVYTYAAVPAFTSIAPVSGSVSGGTSAVITGTGFTGATAVTFGGTAATSYTVDSDTSISATTPAHAAGAVNVVVTTSGGTATGTGVYTYATGPTVTGIAPASGPIAGGTSVVITGTGFTGATAVTFGGTAATSYTVDTATQITAVNPANAIGTVHVTVTTPDGTSVTSPADQYTYATGSGTGLTAVDLNSAADFVILAKSGISTTGHTAIVGDIGVSPIAATGITGFGLVQDASTQFSTSSHVDGKVYAANYGVPTPAKMTAAVADMETAYNDAAGRTSPDHTELGAGDIGGLTLAPGLYKWGTGVTIPTDVTLSGSANDIWIFQIGQGLTTSSGTQVILSGGAQAKNIFWQVAGQTTLGSDSVFNGIILDKTAIVLNSGARLNGRALAQTAVTMIGNGINGPPHGSEVVVITLTPVPTTTPYVSGYTGSGMDSSSGGSSDGGGSADSGGSQLAPLKLAPLAPIVVSVLPEVNGIGVTPVNEIGSLLSAPLIADIVGMPGVAVSWTTQINDRPAAGAKITTAILQNADQSWVDRFTTALHQNGQDLGSLAYVMVVERTGITSTGPTSPMTITMTASREWVSQNGRVEAIRIVGIAEDGTAEVLPTAFAGYDRDSGYPIFKATSTHSLSAFGLIAVTPYTPVAEAAPVAAQMAPAAQAAAPTNEASSSGVPFMMTIGGIFAALAIISVATLIVIRRNKGSE